MRRWWSPALIGLPILLLMLASVVVFADDARKPAVSAPVNKSGSVGLNAKTSAFLSKYCINCHSGTKPKADLNLAAFVDEASVTRSRKVWSRVKEYVESGEMPPEGKPHPKEAEAKAFTDWVQTTLAKADCGGLIDPGRVTLRRLNRSEYNNTIRDLVGVNFSAPRRGFPVR